MTYGNIEIISCSKCGDRILTDGMITFVMDRPICRKCSKPLIISKEQNSYSVNIETIENKKEESSFKCVLCKEKYPLNMIKGNFGDPPEFLCSKCYERMITYINKGPVCKKCSFNYKPITTESVLTN